MTPDSPSTGSNDSLQAALARHALELAPQPTALVQEYCHQLWEWNQKLNLTRHTDYERFVTRDLNDSIQLARCLNDGETVLDVGSGGGVPGVLLAILRPQLRISLSESVGKRATALQAMVESLSLPTPIFRCRAEEILEDARFDALVARAVGPLWKLLKWFQPHWKSIGRLLVVKGPRWVDERGEARHRGMLRGLELRRLATYTTPGTDVENVILKIWPRACDEP
jgi:16S rRNA (guanine527-N7)-methyltransferase